MCCIKLGFDQFVGGFLKYYYIPERFAEGYGPNKTLKDEMIAFIASGDRSMGYSCRRRFEQEEN